MCYLFNLYYKAFELKKKNNKYGICGSILGWIENYLFNRQQKAEIDGFTSSTETVNAAFSLGFFFLPFLFLLFINISLIIYDFLLRILLQMLL